jgi:hypothetical protein
MVEEIEDAHADAGVNVSVAKRQRDRPRELNVKRRKARETVDIPWSHIFAKLVLEGVRKTGVQVIDLLTVSIQNVPGPESGFWFVVS